MHEKRVLGGTENWIFIPNIHSNRIHYSECFAMGTFKLQLHALTRHKWIPMHELFPAKIHNTSEISRFKDTGQGRL